MKNIKLRKFRQSDVNELMSVWDSAQILAHPFLPADFTEKERFNIPNLYIPIADTLVAENNGHVIGFISMIDNEIGGLFVHPDFHGHGVGTALVNKVCELHDFLIVDVFENNTIGRRFYEKYGFKCIGEKFHSESGQNVFTLKYL